MGVSQSVESEDEFLVPVVEQSKHNRCTVRVPHQLEIRRKKGNCRIMRQKLQKSNYFCVSASSVFVLLSTVITFVSGTRSVAIIIKVTLKLCLQRRRGRSS